MLSVIFPVRCGAPNSYLLDRLAANLELFAPHDWIECVVVDSASPAPFAERIARMCQRPRCTRVVDPSPLHPFAPGQTRNVGAQHARGSHLLFYDVDLCFGPGFVAALQRWMAGSTELSDFLVIPCLYLTSSGTRRAAFRGAEVDLAPYLASYLSGDNALVDNLAVSTSTIVVARSHFLALGGNRADYLGHGCEDFDLLHRLASYRPDGQRPDDYYVDHRTRFPGDYTGFRAYLARYALAHLFDGPYTAHLWHARPLSRPYFRKRRRNEALLQDFMRHHDRGEAARPMRSLIDPATPVTAPTSAPWTTSAPPPPPIGAFIRGLMKQHGLDPAAHPGLFQWKAGVSAPRGQTASRMRKLLLRPHEFFADSRIHALRRLKRLFPR